jgi:hypothetical protein
MVEKQIANGGETNCHEGTKTLSETRSFLISVYLCALVSWWRIRLRQDRIDTS